MRTHEAEGNGEHLNDIIHGDLRALTAIGGQPEENTVKASNSELHTGNGHGESSLSTSSIQCELVGDVVLEYIIKAKKSVGFLFQTSRGSDQRRQEGGD